MRALIIVFIVTAPLLTSAQNVAYKHIDTSKVEWKSFEETNKLFTEKQKPVLLFMYNEEDDSSLIMLNQVFGLDEVANYINALFYPVKISCCLMNCIVLQATFL